MATVTAMTSAHRHIQTHSRRTPLRSIQMAILNYLNVRSINFSGMGVGGRAKNAECWTTNRERESEQASHGNNSKMKEVKRKANRVREKSL